MTDKALAPSHTQSFGRVGGQSKSIVISKAKCLVRLDHALVPAVEFDPLQFDFIFAMAEPFKGAWALPGGFLAENETLEQCAARELVEETGVKDAHLEPFATFSDPQRDPRGRIISAAFLALVPAADHALQSGSDADDAKWHRIDRLPKLGFDHKDIIKAARQSLASKIHREPLTLALLPYRFTLTRLQTVYEAIEGHAIDKRNFRRSILAKGWIVETGDMERGRQRPAMLYQKA